MDSPLLFKCASLALLEMDHTGVAEKDACVVPRHIWQRWVDRQTTEVLLVEVKQLNQRHVLCVESYHSGPRDLMYIPSSLAMEIDTDEHVEVTLLEEMPPVATTIVLEPLEADTYGFDIAGATSAYLSHWNVLKVGTTLSVPSLEIEGYTMMIHVAKTEPADIVLLRGEVPMELVELAEPEGIYRPPTPMPSPSQKPEDFNETFDSLLPMLPSPMHGFVPFGGLGRRLGS